MYNEMMMKMIKQWIKPAEHTFYTKIKHSSEMCLIYMQLLAYAFFPCTPVNIVRLYHYNVKDPLNSNSRGCIYGVFFTGFEP